MTVVAEDFIRVGRVKIPLATAEAWVQDYTNEEKSRASSAPYAYPAYDRYAEATNDPLLLTDGDLLAPVLLNVRLSIRSFYGSSDLSVGELFGVAYWGERGRGLQDR